MANNNQFNLKYSGAGTASVGNTTNVQLNKGTVVFHKGDTGPFVYPSVQTQVKHDQVIKQLQESLRVLFSSQNAWFVPFPWLTANRYEAEDYFVQLDLEELNRNGTQIKRDSILYDDLFLPSSPATAGGSGRTLPNGPRRILLQGDAGYGKSTLCVKIAHDWAVDCNFALSKFKLVVLLRLRSIQGSFNQSVLNFCSINSGIRIDDSTLKEVIVNLGSEVLLILDGLDEIDEEKRTSIQEILSFNDELTSKNAEPSFLRHCTFLFTTRPNIIDSSFCTLIDRNARIRTLKTPDCFISTYFKDPKIAKSLINKLSKVEFSSEFSPLLLYILCYLHENGGFENFENEHELLKATLKILSTRCMFKEALSYYEYEQWNLFLKLGEIFFKCLTRNKYYIEDEELTEVFGEHTKFIKSCGVLKQPPLFDKRDKSSFEPTHKIFLEFLAISFLNRECEGKSPGECKKFVSSLILKYNRNQARVEIYDLSNGDETVTMVSPILRNQIYVKVQTSKSRKCGRYGKYASEIEFMTYKSSLNLTKELDSKNKRVSSETCVTIRQRDQFKYFPKQFHKCTDFVFSFDRCQKFKFRLFLNVFRDCRCGLDASVLPLKPPESKTEVYPGIGNFKYTEKSLCCVDCRSSFLRTSDMLKRSCSMSHTIIASVTPSLLFSSVELLKSLLTNDCSLCLLLPGYADGSNGSYQLHSALTLLMRYGLRCANFDVYIDYHTDMGDLFLHLVSCVFSTHLEIPVTCTVKCGHHSCTFIPDTKNKKMGFYPSNSQSQETELSWRANSTVTKFVSSTKSFFVRKGMFKVTLTIGANSAPFLIEWQSENQIDHEDNVVTFQILRNRNVYVFDSSTL